MLMSCLFMLFIGSDIDLFRSHLLVNGLEIYCTVSNSPLSYLTPSLFSLLFVAIFEIAYEE